ncbi:HAD family hydrolase [Gleimia hominis]|uniref:HAD family hydrolase n=1 Tax=Gleimia hominis TaxID=595468 RepID=UPI000C8086B0|nr:HAD family hydrolase [Gleimia hominis]WIK64339.1 HAD family hydrolase [Gleimia hominis]
MSNPLLTPPPTTLPPMPFEHLLDQAAADLPGTLEQAGPNLLVALDLDGTLLTVDGATPRSKQAVAQLQDAGAHVVLSTGRGINATLPVLEEVGIRDGWAVCSNGAITLQITDGHAQAVQRFDFDPQPTISTIVREFPDAFFGCERLPMGYWLSRPFPPGELLEDEHTVIVKDIADVASTRTTKLIVRELNVTRDEFAQRIGQLDLPGVEIAVGWTAWLDVSAEGVTKASGLEALREQLGVPETGTVAIGDGTNDLAMLQWAHHGVAMQGASDEVKAAANAVTGPAEYDGAPAVMAALLGKR